MKARFILITTILCAMSLTLSAQKTFLWTLIIDGGEDRYQMYELDFFAGNPTLYFSIEKSRFNHLGMTGLNNEISGFEFNSDQTEVYFMEREGDLYKYIIATDNLIFLKDVIPEVTPSILVFAFTQILNIFFINDSTLYCAGLTYGEYNINTNIFTKIRQPINHPISFTPYEQDLLATETTKHKGQYLYVSNSSKIMLMNFSNPDLNAELLNLGPGSYIAESDIISYQFKCDSTNLYLRGSLFGASSTLGWYKLDLDSGIVTFSHPQVDIPNACECYNFRHYNQPRWEDCQLLVDLDLDDNTASGNDYFADSVCLHLGIPISDGDIIVRNDKVVDSISIQLKNPGTGNYLDFPAGNYVLIGNGTDKVSIINNGTSLNTDFENAILGGRYLNSSTTAVASVQIECLAWNGLTHGDTATAILSFVNPLPNAGVDTVIMTCVSEINLDPYTLLPAGSQSGGVFYDLAGSSVDEISIDQAGNSSFQYIVESMGCVDSSDIEVTIAAAPVLDPVSDFNACFGTLLDIDLTAYSADVLWMDGVDLKQRQIDLIGEYSYQVTSSSGCFARDSFIVNISAKPIQDIVSAKTCPGDSLLFQGQFISAAGQYYDTIQNAVGCDSINYVLDFDFFVVEPIILDGDTSFCEGGTASISVISSTTQLMLNQKDISPNFKISKPGDYILTGIDKNSCPIELQFTVESFPTPTVSTSDLLDTVLGQGLLLPVAYIGNIINYEWKPAEYLSCSDCAFPTLLAAESGLYRIEVANEFGCSYTATINVDLRDPKLYVPNMIANNPSDPLNGIFFVQGNSGIIYDLMIFDRWGNIHFSGTDLHMNDSSVGWEPAGKVNPGVFVYMITYTIGTKQKVIAGDVTVR